MLRNIVHAVALAVVLMLCACSQGAVAQGIASAASGIYITPDRICRVELARYGQDHINVDLLCIGDATGMPTYSHTTVFAFAGSCIAGKGVTSVFQFSGPSPAAGFVAFDVHDLAGLHVRVAPDASTLYNGGGQPQVWPMLRPITSGAPYTCAPAAQPRFRVFGR